MNRRERRAAKAQKRHLRVAQRACGTCTACCTVMGVPDLGKGYYERCKLEGRGRCTAYEARPDGCRNFSCQWLLGGLEEWDRPDKIGIVFDISAGGDLGRIPVALEVEKGASERGRGGRAVRLVSQNSPVLVISPDGTRRLVGGPPDAITTLIGDAPGADTSVEREVTGGQDAAP